MNIQNINRLNNEYRAYIYEAESHRITRAGVASREEGLSYQRAAQICGQLASMTTGSEAQYWVDNQSRCEAKMRQIWAELNPREPVKETPAAKPAARPAAKKTDVPQETVDHWYKPDPGYGFDQVSGMEEVKHLLSDWRPGHPHGCPERIYGRSHGAVLLFLWTSRLRQNLYHQGLCPRADAAGI